MTPDERAASLADSEAFSSAPVPYSILDLHGAQLGANAAFHALFRSDEGLSSAELLTHPEDVGRTQRYLAALAEGKADHVVIDKRYVRVDGTTFWGRLTAAPLRDDAGHPELLLGVIEDISPQMETLDQLQAVSDSKSAFVARVCHDLRTPLHAISGLSELLATGELDPSDRQLAESIGRETQALRRIVDELLDLSQIEAGTIAFDRTVFALDQCVHRALEILRPRAIDRGLTLDVHTIGQVGGSVLGDDGRLRQILINLLDNAIKFTASGGVRLEVQRLGESVSFAVHDSGPGIANEDHDRVFEAFAQLHDDRSGSGLGLAISRDLAQAMGGTLIVDSSEGEGSSFTLSLPLPVAEDHPAHHQTEGSRLVVLVVEDSPVNQLLVTNQLDRLGYDCVIAEDGFEAVRVFETGQVFALVLMDWHLPGIDGLEACSRLRRIETESGWPRTPVVAITARSMPGDRQACLESGIDDVVTKPASLQDIESALSRWAAAGEHRRTPVLRGATDTTILEQLLDELGDPDVIHKLVETFLDQLPKRRQRIMTGIAQDDPEEVRRAAHTLKSTSAIVGAWKLEEASRTLEDLATRRSAGLGQAAALVDAQIDEAAARLRQVATSLESP